jgi:hypothetical protein
MRENKTCPICGQDTPIVERYPDYVCQVCAARVMSADQRPLKFYNENVGGGFLAFYADTDEPYFPGRSQAPCFIDGIACIAAEARMGGIVIQVKPEE